MMADLAAEQETLGVPNWNVTETLRRGWRDSPELRHGALGTVALAFLGTGGRLAVPILLRYAIDHAFQDRNVDVTLVLKLATFGAVVVMASQYATRAASLRLGRQGEAALKSLRQRVFAHVHGLSVAQQADFRRGVLVGRVTSDLEMLSQFFVWGGLGWLLDVTLMAVTAVIMFIFDARLAAIVIVVSAPLFILLRLLQQRLVTMYGDVRDRNADFLTSVGELVAGAPVIRAYDAQAVRGQRTQESVQRLRRAHVRAGSLTALLFPAGELFSSLAVATVVVVGVTTGVASHLTAGSLVGFVFLAYRFLEPIGEITEVLDQTQTAVSGWRRALGLLAVEPELSPPATGVSLPAGPPSLALEAVTFRYQPRPGDEDLDREAALKNVSFHIASGEQVAVVGATGSGKSTLARLLTRLADPTEGRVLIAGQDLRHVDDRSLRSVIMLVPQEPFLFDTTIADNVRLGHPASSRAELAQAFADLGLDDWVNGLGDGLDTEVGERGEQLSAGERQLVALARASVASPSCLVLDEATSSVDPSTDATLGRALALLANGRTSVVIAHRLSTAARADRILVMDDGRLVEDGSHDVLVAAGGVYAGLYASWLDATATTGADVA